jgi:LmbE family N-acetylglucosaminyl deacetylase
MRQTIHEAPDLVVIAQDFPSDLVFVSFNAFGAGLNGLRYSDDQLFARWRIASIGVVTAQPNWYPPAALLPAIPAIVAAARGRRIITFGLGHGGYGALKYGGALGAFAALAFKPQGSIDPAYGGGFDRRFARYFDAAANNGAPVAPADLCGANYVVYDPYVEIDRQHAELIIAAGQGAVHPVIVPLARDAAIRMIGAAEEGDSLAALFRGESPPAPAALRRQLRAARRGAPGYQTARFETLLQKRPGKRGLLERLARALPDGRQQVPLLKILVAADRFDEAAEILDRTPEAALRQAGPVPLNRLFHDKGFLAGQLRLAPLLLEHFAGNPGEHLKLIELYLRADMIAEANAAFAGVLAMPDLTNHMKAVTGMMFRLKNPDFYEIVLDRLIADPNLSVRDKILAGVELAKEFRERTIRSMAVRSLRMLRDFHCEDLDLLEKIAVGLERVNENSMALDVRQRLVALAPGDVIRRLDMILAQVRVSKKLAREMLDDLIRTVEPSVLVWQRVSVIFHNLADHGRAAEATLRAMDLGAEELQSRRWLAQLYAHGKNVMAARAEVKRVLAMPGIDVDCVRHMGSIASWIGDKQIAMSCAERQYQGRETEAEATLHLIRLLIDVQNNEQAAALIAGACDGSGRVERAGPNEWLWFANEAARIARGDLELRALEIGIEQYPTYGDLLQRHAEVIRRKQVLGTVYAPEKKPTPAKPKSRFSTLLKTALPRR